MAVAVPVVFGLTLAVNLMLGFTINRVTLFALILSLGLLVDDPIVDVENITRHFALRKKATRRIVLEAVAEIRPPLITATLAVIVSFLPMFFITGMMGPYMRPMALECPGHHAHVDGRGIHDHSLARLSRAPSQVSRRRQRKRRATTIRTTWTPSSNRGSTRSSTRLMAPLLGSRLVAWSFLVGMLVLTVGAMGLAAVRSVPLKMLPFDNKNELLLVLDFDRGTTLERSDAAVREIEAYLAQVPEVADYTSYVGLGSPMDFNGLVRHYYLRQGDQRRGHTDRSGGQKEPQLAEPCDRPADAE